MARQMRDGLGRRKFLQRAGGVVGALSVASLAAACAPGAPAASASGAPATPRKGGTLTYATTNELISLDPAYVGDGVGFGALRLMYEQLVYHTPDLEPKAGLATSWEAKDTAWTFKLRQGVKFHDGTPFNSAAVKAHFDRLLGPEKPTQGGLWVRTLDKVEVVDDATVRFVTKIPDAFLLTTLADNASGFIASPAAFAKFGKDLAKNPVGTGPFRFVEWIKDERFVAIRNDDYWGDKAYLDKVVFRPIPEAESRMIALESGDVQLALRLTPEHLDRVQKNPKLGASVKPTIRNLFISMNNLEKPFSDVRVRQALNLAIDKEGIVKNLYLNIADVSGGALAAGVAGYAKVKGFGFDAAKAKQMLAEAGYPNGFSAVLTGPKGSYTKDFELQQAVQQQLRVIGVNLTLNTVEQAKYLELLRAEPSKKPMEMWLDLVGGVNGASTIVGRFGCNSLPPVSGNARAYCNPQVDTLADQAQRQTDVAKRNDLLRQAQELVSQDASSIWLLALKEIGGYSKKLHGAYHMASTVLTVDERSWLEE